MVVPLSLFPAQPSTFAFLVVEDETLASAEWIRLCMSLTPHVEQVDPSCGVLDLGAVSLPVAHQEMLQTVTRLAQRGMVARAGIGPTSTLAQMALFIAPRDARLAMVAPSQVSALLHRMPVRLLAQVHPCRTVLGPEVIVRLEGYGLHTLGHLARLEARVLYQQFGHQVGEALVALSQGQDLRPVQPTPLPHWHRVRLRWDPALDRHHAQQAVLALPRLVERAIAVLGNHAAGALQIGVEWASGARQVCHVELRQHSADAQLLYQEAGRMLRSMARPDSSVMMAGGGADADADGIEEVDLWLGACKAQQPTQATFWRTRQQRHQVIHTVAERLTHRYGHPLLLYPRQFAPAAIFAEEGYSLLPTGTNDTVDAAAAPGQDGPRSGAMRPITRHSAIGAWDEVPQRLHWW